LESSHLGINVKNGQYELSKQANGKCCARVRVEKIL
jgi:hypothetical protein